MIVFLSSTCCCSSLANGLHFLQIVPKLPNFRLLISRNSCVNLRNFIVDSNPKLLKQKTIRRYFATSRKSPNSMLTILHFNDIYNVEPHSCEPIGGAARFASALKQFDDLKPLIFFSGDAFSPSMLSTFTKGEQMVTVLNDVRTTCAVFGNHDFDHGLITLAKLVAKCEFPWLMSNVIDKETGNQLGDGKRYCVFERNGLKIGVIGLVEEEWLDTLPTIDPEELIFLDFVETGRELSLQLKNDGCDYVIALTHMRMLNDKKLAESENEIDLILGGHDHIYETMKINGKWVVKSGSDFRQFSKIDIEIVDRNRLEVAKINEISVTKAIPEDTNVVSKLNQYFDLIDTKMNEVLGYFSVPLDGRFEIVRSQESNLGNWVCDVIMAATKADLVILNSGTLRSDSVHAPGPFTMRDLLKVVPLRDPLIVLRVSGHEIWKALENGVSQYPKLEGRFPQVAGLSFAFDPREPPGQRVRPEFVHVGDERLELDQYYRLATKSYIFGGCDGYSMLKGVPVLVDGDECPELGVAVQNHFQSIQILMTNQSRDRHMSTTTMTTTTKHRQSLINISRRHSLLRSIDCPTSNDSILSSAMRCEGLASDHNNNNNGANSSSANNLFSKESIESKSCQLAPIIENRIIRIDNDQINDHLMKLYITK